MSRFKTIRTNDFIAVTGAMLNKKLGENKISIINEIYTTFYTLFCDARDYP